VARWLQSRFEKGLYDRGRPLPFGRMPGVSAATRCAQCTSLGQCELLPARGISRRLLDRDDVLGSRHVSGRPIVTPTFKEAVTGAVKTPTITVTDQGRSISTIFVPNFGLTLSQAAALGGYDHFNWQQRIISWTFPDTSKLGFLKDQLGKLPVVPFFDPVLGGFQYHADAKQPKGTFPAADNLRWYWDELYGGVGEPPHEVWTLVGKGDPRTDIARHTTQTTLDYLDAPAGPIGLISFETCLAGVRKDGTGDAILGVNGCFRWKFFAQDEEIIYGGRFHPLPGDPLGNGVIEFLGFGDPTDPLDPVASIPEPSTMVLLSSTAVALFVRLRRRSLT
jgi:hypothetical protein